MIKKKHYIDYFESFYATGKGYNLTQGGQWGSGTQKLTLSEAIEIQNLIQTSEYSFQELADQYAVTIYCISDINRGKSFHNDNLLYPLRHSPERSILTEEKIQIIIDMLENTTMVYKDIALAMDINEYTVGEINRGSNSWCPKDIVYPIRKPIQKSTYQNKITQQEVQEICYKLCLTDIKIEDIGKAYGIAKNTVGDISRGLTWKNITQQFHCPIRKNKLENQKIYASIYGIV